MALVNAMLHLFLRLVKFAGVLLRFHFPHDVREDFGDILAGLAFEALQVEGHLAGAFDGDFKFALGHKSILPMPHFQMDGAVGGNFLLHDIEAAGALVTRDDVHVGFNPIFEYASLPDVEDVVAAIAVVMD